MDKDIQLLALRLVMANLNEDRVAYSGTLTEVGEATGRLLQLINQLVVLAAVGYRRNVECECDDETFFDPDRYDSDAERAEAFRELGQCAAMIPQSQVAKLLGLTEEERFKMRCDWIMSRHRDDEPPIIK